MECSKKSYQVLKLNTGHTTIICKKFPCEKINKYKVYRVEFGHSRCIAKYGDMISVLCFCRDLVLYGRMPGPRIFWGGWIFGILMMIIGVGVFQKYKDKFILYI